MQFLSQGVKVSLDYNNVTYLDLTSVEDWAPVGGRPRDISISIENNPIQCDCRLYDFLRFLEGRLHPNGNETLQLLIGESKCHGPSDLREIAIADLRSKTLTCNVNELESEVECPDKCNCYMRPENNAFIVDCGYKDLMEPPRKLECPPNLRLDHIELNLTGNYLTKMPDLDKNGYKNVTILTLDHNNITAVTVDGLSNTLEVRKIKPLQVFKNFSLSMIFLIGYLKWLCGFQRLKTVTFLRFFFIYPMKYFIQTVYHIKDTYLISTL